MVDRRDFLKMGLAAAAAVPSVSEAQTPAPAPGVTPNANADFDYVIAGGGHNALACAAYLGKAGYKCVVLEAKATVGGYTSTEQLTVPGFWHEACANTPTCTASSAARPARRILPPTAMHSRGAISHGTGRRWTAGSPIPQPLRPARPCRSPACRT